jgi:hypothetical protein
MQGGLQSAKRELVVHECYVQRIQGGRDQGTDRDAGAGPRIGELLKDWSGAGLADYCRSHLFLRSMIGTLRTQAASCWARPPTRLAADRVSRRHWIAVIRVA